MAAKARSKNYPAFGLTEAINKARQLYEQDGKAAVAKEVAVKAWNYNGINGASLRALGALRQYGLIEAPTAGAVKLSDRALAIILEPEDSPDRADAIHGAVGDPAVFNDIANEYPDGLPSDGAIVATLVRKHGFSEDAANSVIAAYRDSSDLAKLHVSGNTSRSRTNGAKHDGVSSSSGGGRVESSGGRAGGGQKMEMAQVFTYSLPGNTTATLRIEGPMPSGDGVKLMGQFLDLIKASFSVSASMPAQASSDTEA